MSGLTPFLECFRRGEADLEVRMLAARGELAPRSHEQLTLLILLLEDADADVRRTANETLNGIPTTTLSVYLGRSDVPVDIREFFADRGVFPDETPAIEWTGDTDAPLVEPTAAVAAEEDPGEDEEVARRSAAQGLAQMSFTERLKAAMKGTREMRSMLIRDTNRMVAAAVLSSPKLTVSEVESFARMPNVGEEVLRSIGGNRAWVKHYGVVAGLIRNPKTPLGMSMNLMSRLNDRDVTALSVDRNVPEALRIAARKKALSGAGRR